MTEFYHYGIRKVLNLNIANFADNIFKFCKFTWYIRNQLRIFKAPLFEKKQYNKTKKPSNSFGQSFIGLSSWVLLVGFSTFCPIFANRDIPQKIELCHLWTPNLMHDKRNVNYNRKNLFLSHFWLLTWYLLTRARKKVRNAGRIRHRETIFLWGYSGRKLRYKRYISHKKWYRFSQFRVLILWDNYLYKRYSVYYTDYFVLCKVSLFVSLENVSLFERFLQAIVMTPFPTVETLTTSLLRHGKNFSIIIFLKCLVKNM